MNDLLVARCVRSSQMGSCSTPSGQTISARDAGPGDRQHPRERLRQDHAADHQHHGPRARLTLEATHIGRLADHLAGHRRNQFGAQAVLGISIFELSAKKSNT